MADEKANSAAVFNMVQLERFADVFAQTFVQESRPNLQVHSIGATACPCKQVSVASRACTLVHSRFSDKGTQMEEGAVAEAVSPSSPPRKVFRAASLATTPEKALGKFAQHHTQV